ncbi:DUF2442 domain-containing protein [Candidatus Poriferisodalis sp.]|uniref:DUF2442 domain-containing protein n=1 Tax=Candidatus Poriferisodalis sp. TaxID=3101277 RepID=UPI003B010F5A
MPVEQLHPTEIQPRSDFRLWVRFNDGSEGEIDLSARAGRGVFKIWDESGVFESAVISPHRTIRWSDDAELCADAVYLEITGGAPEEIMPGLRALADA